MKITKALLKRLNACSGARRLVDRLLPANINTDPDQNIELALKLIALYKHTASCVMKNCTECRRVLMVDLRWLASMVNTARDADACAIEAMYFDGESNKAGVDDLLLVIQMLAVIADVRRQ